MCHPRVISSMGAWPGAVPRRQETGSRSSDAQPSQAALPDGALHTTAAGGPPAFRSDYLLLTRV